MSSKTSADVLIGGKVYTLSGYESEAYLHNVAGYLNNKLNEFEELESYRRLSTDMKSVLLSLNVADDYFKAKDQVKKLEEDVDARDKEIYDLKNELVSVQLKLGALEESLGKIEKENKELLLNKAKLETSLEDALLGKVEPMKKKEKSEK